MKSTMLLAVLAFSACRRSEITLELEVAYPMIGSQESVYAVQRVAAEGGALHLGQQIILGVNCSGEPDMCSLVWPVSDSDKSPRLEGRILMIKPGQVVVVPYPFPVHNFARSEVEGLEFNPTTTKIIEARYEISATGSPALVSWHVLRGERRPPLTWK